MQPDNSQPNYIRVEYSLVIGAALSASGQFYTVVAIFLSWFILKRLRPIADWEILFVASGFIGSRIVAIFLWRETIEQIVVIMLTLTLFYTHSKTWARVLLVYCVVGLLGLIGGLCFGQFGIFQPSFVTSLVLCSLAVWLLSRWLSQQKYKTATAEDAVPNGGPATQLGNSGVPEGPPSVS